MEKSFDSVIRAHIGDCHAMEQTPITYIRQVRDHSLIGGWIEQLQRWNVRYQYSSLGYRVIGLASMSLKIQPDKNQTA